MIEIKDLTKKYNGIVASDKINLKILKGEKFGFLGPNGAGKTTILSMLSTLLEPTSGTALLNKHEIQREAKFIKRDIGVLFQETSLDERLTGRENLEIQAVLYDIPKSSRPKKVGEMLDFVGLRMWADSPVHRYSGGMKRRLEIGRCLLHKPLILLLDEPTLGLDPAAREVIWRQIETLEETVVIATNYIEEAERLCDRIAILDSGKVVALGEPSELKASFEKDIAHITVKKPGAIEPVLRSLPYVEDIKLDGAKIILSLEKGKRKNFLELMGGYDLDSIEIRKPDLNDVFLAYTGKSIEVPVEGPRGRRRMGRRK
jgi:ABC-2 type transport system ATP-binding protein